MSGNNRKRGTIGGRDGLISTRLTSVRSGIVSTANTISATSSGAIFQDPSVPLDLGENSVSTLPGIIVVTRIPSCRWSSIIASLIPFSPNFDAL